MMKIVPDPPPLRPSTIIQTALTPFCSCNDAHEALFNVSAGIPAEDALRHVAQHLQSAYQASHHIYVNITCGDNGLHWATLWALDAAKVLVEALRDGIDDAVVKPTPEGDVFVPGTVRKTASAPFCLLGSGDKHLFSVRSHVPAEDVLVHVSLYLQSAHATANELCRQTPKSEKGMHWAALHAIEVAQALVEALLDGSDSV
ncbi:DUF3077 domain-containing protein [Pseudomonas sp. R5(2019)]|uniref:DUF3077 domain-containing protein n=1 Tax=Pseudomonas sp. R5(2019) TaxID=2697566 RepID=UPI0014124B47|nr:DUF3077 domain-containing protein [Pseudomonas sp. R5(2019)]NBA97708.1 DUF3077 domain-containing protein [Pseudomonas sp. R5(2019)]